MKRHVHVYNKYNFVVLKISALSPAGDISNRPTHNETSPQLCQKRQKKAFDCRKIDINNPKGGKRL